MRTLLITMVLALVGCASQQPQVQCDTLRTTIAVLEGKQQMDGLSKDELRVLIASRILYDANCQTGARALGVAKIDKPREPRTLTVNGAKYKLAIPFSIIDPQGESVFRDVTLGPLYRRVIPRGTPPDSPGCLYSPPLDYLVGVSRRPSYMIPIGCQ